jgi:uncharacterized protein YndB with AHSA1/START domain
LVLTWDINADWKPDPNLKTEVEIRFVPDGDSRTRIELEHRHLDRFGARRDEMRRVFEQDGAWGTLLSLFIRVAEQASSS